MKLTRRKISVLFLILIPALSKAQSFSYRNNEFTWEQVKPSPINVDPIFAKEDAVILDENLIYNISGNQTPLYNYLAQAGNTIFVNQSTQGKFPVVQKHVRIKFLTQSGIQKYSTIVLPETFDPQHEQMIVPIQKRKTRRRPRGEFECIRYFAARIHKADGREQEAKVEETTEKEIVPTRSIDQTFYSWLFKITNLEPGDELEVDYSYEGTYTQNPSSRIFFNGEMPKQNYQLTLREKEKDLNMVFGHNGAGEADTMYSKGSILKYRDFIFKRHNLSGGITETGARPAFQLPYISFYHHNLDYGQYANNSPVINSPLPYPWWFILSKMLSFQYENLKMKLSWTDNSTTAINSFLNEERSKLPNASAAFLMSGIQHTINDSFDYEADNNYIEGSDSKLEKLGKNIDNKKLRFISRSRFYSELFLRLDTDYFLSLLPDKRSDILDPNQFETPNFESRFYALPVNNNYIFFYPKGSRFGYEANEFPFYHEGVLGALVPQRLPVSMKNDILPNVDYPFVMTPTSSYNENSRNTIAMVNASLDSLSMKANGKLKLSGQFSTLTRGYFLFGAMDTTVNTSYYKTVLDLADVGQKVSLTNINVSSLFPFEANFQFSFSKNNFITKESDGTYSFALDGWFNNITDTSFRAENRHLNYYPDFKSEDVHRFMIQFDHKIQLLETEQLTDTIKNVYGFYILKAEQKGEQNILIETSLIVNSDMITAEKANDVGDIFKAIQNWNKRRFKIKMI